MTIKSNGVSGSFFLKLLCISPGFILMFFFNDKVLVNNFISIDLFDIIIIDSIIFIILFVIGLARDIKVPENKEEDIEYEDNIIMNIIKTTGSMAIISIVLIVVFAVVNFRNINFILRVGIIALIITIILLNIRHIYTWIKVVTRFKKGKVSYKKAIKNNKKANEALNDLPDDDDDEI